MKLFLVFIMSASTLHAKDKDIIDLGSLEVQGQVRQPSLQVYQQQIVPQNILQKVSEENFEKFEKELLAPGKKQIVMAPTQRKKNEISF